MQFDLILMFSQMFETSLTIYIEFELLASHNKFTRREDFISDIFLESMSQTFIFHGFLCPPCLFEIKQGRPRGKPAEYRGKLNDKLKSNIYKI